VCTIALLLFWREKQPSIWHGSKFFHHKCARRQWVLVAASHKHLIIEKKQEKMTLLGLRKTSWPTLVTTEEIQDLCARSASRLLQLTAEEIQQPMSLSAHQQFD
jgi:hypothetical protein